MVIIVYMEGNLFKYLVLIAVYHAGSGNLELAREGEKLIILQGTY